MFRKFFMAATLAVFAIGGTTACASKKFVRTNVGQVNDKVDSLGRTVEETQERTRQNEGRISDVDQRAQAGIAKASQAAEAANTNATNAATAASGASAAAKAVDTKVDAMDKANKRLVFEVVLSEDSGNFKFGKVDLPQEAKAKLDEMIEKLKADPKGAFFEIEGHTDNVGDAKVNERIGLERAEAVKRYLYEQHQIPLHKMNVISYGEDKPVAPNKTKEGRAQNRRVVVKVLA
jgi:outer membrane protein OmpA-like peptidoglycan-associated protein